MFRKSN